MFTRSARPTYAWAVLMMSGVVALSITIDVADFASALHDTRDIELTSAGTVRTRVDPSDERVIIRAAKPYASLVATIEAAGGRVRHQFKYVDAIAVEIPRDHANDIRRLLSSNAISEDTLVSVPEPPDPPTLEEMTTARSAEAIPAGDLASFAADTPEAYGLGDATTNISSLHAQGIAGQGVVVAVIDTGIRPDFPHLRLDGSVVGGEDLVGDGLGYSNDANHGHGTVVAGMVSANAVFSFGPHSLVRGAIEAECPTCFTDPPTNSAVAMIGSAPLSSIYVIRVFGPSGSAPLSRVVAGMERVIELRQAFDSGIAGGVNIQVCNMSFGGAAFSAGHELQDAVADAMLEHGIVPVVSASNDGPSSLTIGSPGSSMSALTVGAASVARNDRVTCRIRFGSTEGPFYRLSTATQTAVFSSRGPTADGRADPDVIAGGVGVFSQGFARTPLAVSFPSGTSMSAGTVAGIAALMRQSFPAATACQIRNAIALWADPEQVTDGSTVLDRGSGYVDARAAAAALASGAVPDTLPAPAHIYRRVASNVERGGFLTVRSGRVEQHITGLNPGQRAEIVYNISQGTKWVEIELPTVQPELEQAMQNPLFGDQLVVAVHCAKTSATGSGAYLFYETVDSGERFTIEDPEPGLMRITLLGASSNAGKMSADVEISSVIKPSDPVMAHGPIFSGQVVECLVTIPPGVGRAEFQLCFRNDWSRYPSSNLDVNLVQPDGAVTFSAATLDAPEWITVDHPVAGTWMLRVTASCVPASMDRFKLRTRLVK